LIILDPKDVLIPTNYKGKQDDGTDIALIGLSKDNKIKIVNYFKQLYSTQSNEFKAYKYSLCL
jgi:hypothetical protein